MHSRLDGSRFAASIFCALVMGFVLSQPADSHEAHRRPPPGGAVESVPVAPPAPAVETAPVAESALMAFGHEHHAETDTGVPGGFSILSYMGRFHPVAVHFPIALLVTALFLEVMRFIRPLEGHDAVMNFLVTMAAITAPVAGVLGFLFAGGADYPPELVSHFVWHRALGVTTTVLAIAAWLTRPIPEASASRRSLFKVILALAAVVVSATGLLGAMLTFGPGHLMP